MLRPLSAPDQLWLPSPDFIGLERQMPERPHAIGPAAESSMTEPPVSEPSVLEPAVSERRSRQVTGWQVVHACDSLRPVLPVAEAQAAVGMRPFVLTPQGECLARHRFPAGATEKRKPGSLLTAWNEVRNWRRNLAESEVESGVPAMQADLVHAHCFPAGMAAVRNCRAVIYTLYQFIEELAHSQNSGLQNSGKDHSWLARSFAVAEQFVLVRAGAVVVESGKMRDRLLERGCAPENVFQVPEPLDPELIESLARRELYFPQREQAAQETVFFAPDVRFDRDPSSSGELNGSAACLLGAFARIRREVPGAKLFVPATPAGAGVLLERSIALGIAESLFAMPAADCQQMFPQADVIIAMGDPLPEGGNATPDAVRSEGSSHHHSAAMRSMIAGAALLAADTCEHRDLSAEGRGLLWFEAQDPQDLAARAAFLARNPDLRLALGTAARGHLVETRSPEAIGRQYDAIYRHVFGRRKSDRNHLGRGLGLQPVAASL